MPKVDIVLKGRVHSVPQRQAKALVRHGIASYADAPKRQTYKTRALTAEETETASLRREYEAIAGKKPFMGWGADMLKEKIQEYARRDMKAEDTAEPAEFEAETEDAAREQN